MVTIDRLVKRINNIVNGTFIPSSTTKNIQYSCGLKDNAIDNLAQGSVAIAKNSVFKRNCWRCKTEYQVKGLKYDDECPNPNCRQRSNNPEFIKLLHESHHMSKAFKFSGLAKDSPPIPASTSTFVPRTLNHEDIFHNSSRVAQASNNNSSAPGNIYKERQQKINTLNKILQFSGIQK